MRSDMFDETCGQNAVTAYASASKKSKAIQRTINVVVAGMTIVLNFIFVMARQSHPLGIYALLGFVALLYIFDAIVSYPQIVPRSVSCHAKSSISTHMHMPHVYSEMTYYIGVWLAWWISTQFMYQAGVAFEETRPLYVLYAIFVVFVAAGQRDRWFEPMLSDGTFGGPHLKKSPSTLNNNSIGKLYRLLYKTQRVSVDLCGLFFILSLAFPNAQWTPQQNSWAHVVFRVVVYFAIIFIVDWTIARTPLYESDIIDSVNYSLKMSRCRKASSIRTDDTDVKRLHQEQLSEQICTIVDHYDASYAAERLRVKRIFAQTAWILVVPLYVLSLIPIFVIVCWCANMCRKEPHYSEAQGVAKDFDTKPKHHSSSQSTRSIDTLPQSSNDVIIDLDSTTMATQLHQQPQSTPLVNMFNPDSTAQFIQRQQSASFTQQNQQVEAHQPATIEPEQKNVPQTSFSFEEVKIN